MGAGRAGPVVVDCAALQSPTSRGRGIGRYAKEWAVALEAVHPELVCAYLLDPALPPPGDLGDLVETGKVAYRGAGSLPPGARVLHCLSPLDEAIGLETLWPREATARDLRRSATVYDLIPAKDPEANLADLTVRHRYRLRLEALRAADQLHAISAGVGADLEDLLRVPAMRIVVAGAAPSARFVPRAQVAPGEGVAPVLAASGIRGPFVLYPTGSHPRKNNEGLLAAWALLPEAIRRRVQLVLAGDLPGPTAHHLRHLAGLGRFGDGIVVTGEVDDEVLLRLYQDALLVCFPSLAEGYGLPVAEALACATPVIGADGSPLDELLGPEARFDASSPQATAAALEAAIEDPARRAALLSGARRPASWAEVARRSAEALEALAARPRRRGRARRGRPRLAFVSPLPPADSGVAAYSSRLVSALSAVGPFEVDCFADGPTPDQVAPEGARALFRVDSLAEVDRLIGGYDEVVYALGNSHHHLGALAMLRQQPGIVIAHDVRLTNLYRHEAHQAGRLPASLAESVRALYGDGLPAGLGEQGDLSAAEIDRYGLLMAREAIALSRRFLVSSRSAADLALVDARPDDVHKIDRLPFAFAAEAGDLAGFGPASPTATATAGAGVGAGTRPGSPDGPVVAHFGIVDPSKQPILLLDAFAVVHARLPRARLTFVGPVSDALADEVRARAAALGVAGSVTLTGTVSPAAYAEALASATVAVQLRASSNGEASAAIGDCLAAGRPTVVTDLGWARELPGQSVVQVDRRIEAAALGDVLLALLADDRRREALGRAGRLEASRRTFEATAAALAAVGRVSPGGAVGAVGAAGAGSS